MCGRYVLRATKKAIADWFGADPEHLPEFGSSFNIAPQTFQPVVRLSPESGEREIVLMRWGLAPFWARDARDGVKRINARAESIVITASFREAIKKRRCLVPADAFFRMLSADWFGAGSVHWLVSDNRSKAILLAASTSPS
jgi:putative SOS response-associated peptidase YedK